MIATVCARRQAGGGEAGGIGERAFPEVAVGDRCLFVAVVQEHGQPVRLALDVVLERLDQRLRVLGIAHALRLREARDRAVGGLRRLALRREQEAQEIARRLARGERLLGQAGGELALQAQHQLDARQAVEAELALERAVERDVGFDVRARFARHRGDYATARVGIDLLGKRPSGYAAASVHSG